MANPEHLEILYQGKEVWNRWRDENPEIVPDLSAAYYTNFNFIRANLKNAKCFHTIFADVESQ